MIIYMRADAEDVFCVSVSVEKMLLIRKENFSGKFTSLDS